MILGWRALFNERDPVPTSFALERDVMQLSRLFSILALCLTLLTGSAWSQVPAGQKTAADNRAESTSPSKRETDRLLNERRSRARSILISLANDALSFPDMPLRARCLARIADALWEADAEQARSLFRKSWASAETADRESKEPLRIRRQVLAVLGRRDRALAEELLQKLKVDSEDQSKQTNRSLWELPEALQQRLSLAFSLLRTGDTERALQFADPILNTVNISTIDFLVHAFEEVKWDEYQIFAGDLPDGLAQAVQPGLIPRKKIRPGGRIRPARPHEGVDRAGTGCRTCPACCLRLR